MKAFYYLPNYGADSCLATHSNQYLFSEVDETNLWCDPKRYSTLLGLDFGISTIAFNLAFIFVALVSYSMF
jgi:hypothetical protein